MEDKELIKDILKWKRKRQAVILVHNYQRPEVQDIGDFVGDSLQLSQEAAKTHAKMIVFCGVHFMAETAKILNPEKRVVMPDLAAGCPMASMIDASRLKRMKKEHPKARVVCYVNTTAEVKAGSDICCTSSNAQRIADSLDSEEIIFVPDKYLGEWTARKSGKRLILYPGYCPTHAKILDEDILRLKKKHPHALVLCHPECSVPVKAVSDFVLSTGQMLKTVRENPAREFIIATEQGILHQMEKQNPGKRFYHASESAVCPNMKKANLLNVLDALKNPGEHEVRVEKKTADRARKAIQRMLDVSKALS
jgi:quinolinate synthase